ncbi:MAG: response regulator transcription factor [Anaerolineales bacterium]|nr:response regulator transcription factor [Anaerolineales bacterium]
MNAGIRILLAEDHTIVRNSMAMLLSSYGFVVVGEAETGQEAVEKALLLRPDLILLDITLPDFDGIEVTRRICADWPQAKILALTMHSEDVYLIPFLEAGGSGYVCKSAADRDVLSAIESIMKGETFVAEDGVKALLRVHSHANNIPAVPGPEMLSERERMVLKLTARGYTSREIGDQIGISPRTVETYRSRILVKLGLEHRYELVEYALQHRIIEPLSG